MADIGGGGGLSLEQLNVVLASALAGKANTSDIATQYVSSTTMTVATLLATYPASVTYLGKYARVNNLYGTVDEILRCRFDGTNYNWVPQRETFNGVSTLTTGSMTIQSLVTPPTLRFPNAATGNISPSFVNTNCYVGQRQRFVVSGALGVYGFTVAGLVGSNVSILTGGVKDFEFGTSGWFLAS